jgi:hypothetical protein
MTYIILYQSRTSRLWCCVVTYTNIWHHNPEKHNQHFHHCGKPNLLFHTYFMMCSFFLWNEPFLKKIKKVWFLFHEKSNWTDKTDLHTSPFLLILCTKNTNKRKFKTLILESFLINMIPRSVSILQNTNRLQFRMKLFKWKSINLQIYLMHI